MAAKKNRVGGTMYLQVNGEVMDAVGEFSYNLGTRKRTGVTGTSGPQGYIEEQQIPFIEGKIRDRSTLKVKNLTELDDVTVTVRIAAGKTVMLREGWFAGDGNVNAATGEVEVRFEGMLCEEV